MDNFNDKVSASSGSSRSQEQSGLKRGTSADGFEGKTAAEPSLAELQNQMSALRHLVISVLILLVVISGTFSIYLLRQWRTTHKDLAAFRPQATQIISEYQRVSAPAMGDFVKKVTEYGRTHPDFAPVLVKYGLKPGGAPGAAPANAIAPPPAAPRK